MNKIKKIIIPILIIAMFFVCIPKTENAANTTLKLGDINADGVIDSRDTLKILEHIAASTISKIKQKHSDWILTGEKLKVADINGDGLVDSRDTIKVLEYIAASNIPAIAKKHPNWVTYIESKWIVEATGITLDKTSITIEKGKLSKLTATITPSNTTNKIVTWSSSNTKVATVDGLGNVEAKSGGIAIITAKTSNNITATCEVTVNEKVFYVSKSGSDSNSGTSPSAALKTIKKGISKLSAGYTLVVNAGTYYEDDITLSKKGTSTNPIKIVANGNVTIDGSGKKRLLKINNAQNVSIEGFTFQNLNADNAKGILIEPSANNISISNCKFNNIKTKHPKSEEDGASAIFLDGRSTTAINNIAIKNCTLTNIGAGYSEAISVDGNCTNITITGVTVTYTNGLKGNIGICICGNYGTCSNKSLDRPRNVTISNCNVSNCKSPYDPGSAYGIYVDGGKDVTISNNIVQNCEGGIEIGAEQKNSKLTYETENIKALNNTIKNCGIGAQIGGWDGKAIVYNVLFDNNTLQNCGHNGGKPIEFSKCKKVTISNCKFSTKQSNSYENSSMAQSITKTNNTYGK